MAQAKLHYDPIQPVAAEKKPKLACIGKPSIVQPGYVSRSEMYIVQPISLEGSRGLSQDTTFYLLYRPEWLRRGFDPSTITDDGMRSVYRRHINAVNRLAALKALAGSEEGFATLAEALLDLNEVTPEAVSAVLDTFFKENEPEVGYILTQRYDALETDSGRKYVATDFYQVGSWFYPTDEAISRLRKQAENVAANLEVLFDEEVPF